MTAFILQNGFDCSCSQQILQNTDGIARSITATDIDECEDLCLQYNNRINVATFFKTSVSFLFPFVGNLKNHLNETCKL
uniref:Apple domain-containing protein n=1 Tax=Mesocestoides corti TaxID=53468 RepID=A0A5K3ENV7_MESCO